MTTTTTPATVPAFIHHGPHCPGHAALWAAGGVDHAADGTTFCTTCGGDVVGGPARGIAPAEPCPIHDGCTVHDVTAVYVNTVGARIRVRGRNGRGAVRVITLPYDHGARDAWAAAVVDYAVLVWGANVSTPDIRRNDDDDVTNRDGRTVRRYVVHVAMTAPGDPRTVYAPGERVFRWWDTGAFGMTAQPLTVVRVNRRTVTVTTDAGSTFRIPPADIGGRWTDDD